MGGVEEAGLIIPANWVTLPSMLSDDAIKERFLQAIDAVCQRDNISLRSLCKQLKYNQSFISQVRSRPAVIRPEFIASLCQQYLVSPYWVILGQGDMFMTTDPRIDKILKLQERVIEKLVDSMLQPAQLNYNKRKAN